MYIVDFITDPTKRNESGNSIKQKIKFSTLKVLKHTE